MVKILISLRTLFVLAMMASFISLATIVRGQQQFSSAGCACTTPIDTGIGFGGWFPPYMDMFQKLSPNGKMLVYVDNQGDGGAFVLNLKTLADTQIIVKGGLPHEIDDHWAFPVFCPYDSDLLALSVSQEVDTTSDPGNVFYTENFFTYRISTGEYKMVSPPASAGIYNRGITLISWLQGSRPGLDSFVIQYSIAAPKYVDSFFYGIYVPQTQVLIPDSIMMRDKIDTFSTRVLARSRDGSDSLWVLIDPVRYYIDSVQMLMPSYPFPVTLGSLNEGVGSSRVDLQACKLEYSIVSPK